MYRNRRTTTTTEQNRNSQHPPIPTKMESIPIAVRLQKLQELLFHVAEDLDDMPNVRDFPPDVILDVLCRRDAMIHHVLKLAEMASSLLKKPWSFIGWRQRAPLRHKSYTASRCPEVQTQQQSFTAFPICRPNCASWCGRPRRCHPHVPDTLSRTGSPLPESGPLIL